MASSAPRVPKQPMAGERRHVTALFCDLVDSVPLAVRLDPEDLLHVLDVFAEACDSIIAEHGGSIVQFMGDGVLAYFGYPRANEDDAANAVAAAMKLRDAIGSLDLPDNVSLHARIGLASGVVVVGDIIGSAQRQAGAIVGEPPNLAARLQSVARPDAVVVSGETWRLTRGLFRYRNLGTLTLKGFSRPVAAFELIDAERDPTRFTALGRGRRSPLVGRNEVMEMLDLGWATARAGRGGAFLLRGEPGIGKSRLADELSRGVTGEAAARWHWDCGPRSGDSTLAPIVRFLAQIADFDRGDDDARRREKFESLVSAFGETDPISRALIGDLLGVAVPGSPSVSTLAPINRRMMTLETLMRLLDRASASGPALFVIEDLHWCDSTTQDLVGRVIALAPDRRWLLVMTARPQFHPDWPADAAVTTIVLDRLGRADAERICAALGATSLLSASTVARILERSDGVPLYVEEMSQSAIEAAARGESDLAVPATVHDSLIARLDRLGPARRVAGVGAVIGRRFGYGLLARVADLPETELRRSLRSLALSGLIEASGLPPDSRYAFKHALIRDAAYDSLLKRDRQVLHRLIAAALREDIDAVRAAQPELLAYHLTESGEIAEAIPLWAEAGAQAAVRAAHVEAMGHYETALELQRGEPASDERSKAELRLLLPMMSSVSAARGYAAPELARLMSEARALSDGLGEFDGRFELQRSLYLFSRSAGDMETAEVSARQCAASAALTGSLSHRIEADHSLATVIYARGELREGLRLFDRSIQLYWENRGEALDYAVPIEPFVMGHIGRAWILWAMGEPEQAVAAIDLAVRHARSLGTPFHLAGAQSFGSAVYMFMGDYTSARSLAVEAVRLGEEHGFQTLAVIAALSLAFASGHLANSPTDVAAVAAMLKAYEKLGVFHKYCLYLRELGRLRAAESDWSSARESIDAAIAAAHRHGDGYFLSVLHLDRAEMLLRTTRREVEAINGEIDIALAIARAQGATGFERQALALRRRIEVRSI